MPSPRVCLLAALFLLFAGRPAAASVPGPNVERMCLHADLIVEGTADEEGDGFTVTAVINDPRASVEPGDRITVSHLGEHSRLLDPLGFGWGDEITTRQAVLFLVFDEVGDSYTPIGYQAAEGPRGSGSSGVVWWDDERCLGYPLFGNTNGYSLVELGEWPDILDIEALRGRIAEGLILSNRWREIKAIQDPRARAEAIAAAWQEDSRLKRLFDLRREMALLGEPAVDPLIGLLESSGNTVDLNPAVLALASIGRHHPESVARATGLLCERLADPGPTHRYYTLCALTSTRDPAAVPSVRPVLAGRRFHLQTRTQAALALAAMADTESFEAVVAVLDEVIAIPREEGRHTGFGYAVDLLNALYQLDPERAEAEIERVRRTPGIGNAVSHIPGRNQD